MQPANASKTILVTGATGHQGGAVARHLLRRGWQVRCLVRKPDKPQARELSRYGAELVQGDFDDPASVSRAMRGVHGVFSVQNFWETGTEGEIRQGSTVAEMAHQEGVNHFVYSSVGSANRQTGIPHFDSKAQIEERIKLLHLPYTILRPVFFMENWEMIVGQMLQNGRISLPLDPDKPLQQIAVDDIGFFAALAFEHPDDWVAHETDLAGDERTMEQVVAILSNLLGRRIEYSQMAMDQFRRSAGEDMASMYQWFNDAGYQANIHYLRRQHPGLKTLPQFLKEQDWIKKQMAAGTPGARP